MIRLVPSRRRRLERPGEGVERPLDLLVPVSERHVELLSRLDHATANQFPREGRVKRAVSGERGADRKSTRLNSSHVKISYAVFCLKTKKPKSLQVRFRKIQNRPALCLMSDSDR